MGKRRPAGGSLKSIGEIAAALETLAPAATAEDWDNVGLLAGDPSQRTRGAVISIDLTRGALEQAKRRGFSLIVTHHPAIFPRSRGLSRVVASSKAGNSRVSSLIYEAVKDGISVLACHTNFDRCALEVVQGVSNGLGVVPKGRLQESGDEAFLKLVVFVPEIHLEAVRRAVCDAGAGQIGAYDSCTFAARGTGTFRGGEATRPFIGKPGRFESTPETRLETILPRGLRGAVVSALLKAHPYEEVAYDIYPVEQASGPNALIRGVGYGFWGEFPEPRAFSDLSRDVTKIFHLNGFILSRPPDAKMRKVRRIAFVAGKGASFIPSALARGCDVFITGEAGYHAALDGSVQGMAVVEIGHRESEYFYLTTMEGWMRKLGLATLRLNVPTQTICR